MPPALSRSELRQGLTHFLDQAANSTWPNRVCWSRLIAVNRIAVMMASLRLSCPFQLTFPVFLKALHGYLNRISLFFKPLSLWPRIFHPRNFSDYRSRLLLVVSVVLSRLGSSLLFSSLVWYVALLLPMFTFSCFGFHGSLVVIACLRFLTFLAGVLSSAF